MAIARKLQTPVGAQVTEEKNRLVWSPFTGRFYFAPRSRVVDGKVWKIVGRKYDVTDDLQRYLSKKYRREET
jgi:hypothetical protein